jgi:hypothetical protein
VTAAKIWETAGNSELLAFALESAGRGSYELGEYAAAAGYYDRCVTAAGKLGAPGAEQLVYCRSGRGRARIADGDVDGGLPDVRAALAGFLRLQDPPMNAMANANLAIADALWRQGQKPEARRAAQTAREQAQQNRNKWHGSDGLVPTYQRAADRQIARIDTWIAAHK